MDNVHTFRLGPSLTSLGLLQSPHVSAGSQCLQGLEDGSSPTSGTADPLVGGAFCFTCGHGVWCRPSDGWVAGCGPGCRGAFSGVWGSGFKALAGWPSACCRAGLRFLVPVMLVGWPWWRTSIHAAGEWDNMTFTHLLSCAAAGRSEGPVERVARVLLSCQTECVQCPHLYLLFEDEVIELA